MKKIIIGVMGPGDKATPENLENALQLGQLIAAKGWVLLTGGRNSGVMEKATQGAKLAGGLTIGILPDYNRDRACEGLDIPIITDMGSARNNINVLSSDVVIACGMGLGTASEIALALKNGKSVILLTENELAKQFFSSLSQDKVFEATNPASAIDLAQSILLNNEQ